MNKYNITEEKILLYVGRLSSVKRVEYVLYVTNELLKNGYKIKTVIKGDGPKRAYLEKIATNLGINVIFTGYIPQEEKNIFKKARTFVMNRFWFVQAFFKPSILSFHDG